MTAPLDISAVIEDAVAAAVPAPAPVATPEPESQTAQYVPPVEEQTDATETDADPQAPTDDAAAGEDASEADAVALPEGFVVVEPVAEGLVTEFTLKDAAGEELEVPALMVEYKANGKIRTDRLDQVVKLAKFGVYNQERETRVQQIEQEARTVAEQREQIAEMLAEREAQLERLLIDDDFFLAVQERFNTENSPERRAARAEEQLQSLQVERELQQISAVGQAFLDTELEPALRLMEQALPTVSRDELDERLEIAMQAHLVRGPGGVPYLPESRYAAVRKYIVEDLARWAQMVHLERSESRRDPEKERLVAERDKARIDSQKAKRQMTQAMNPVTRAAAPANAGKPRPKAPATLDDAVDSAMSAVLSSLR